MYVFYSEDLKSNTLLLNEEESRHSTKVLRKKEGDIIHLFDGKGTRATAKINSIGKRNVQVIITNRSFYDPDPYYLHIAVAPTKQLGKIEWFIEKAIEYGIHEISFIETKNTEKTKVNIDRIKKIALSAAKQSLANYLPKINPIVKYEDFILLENHPTSKYIATLVENTEILTPISAHNYLFMIGPEGGFTPYEVSRAISQSFTPISLGPKRLRTETAALFYPALLYQINLNK